MICVLATMPLRHFMGADFLAILQGFCFFSLVALFPGYAIGWLTNVLRFSVAFSRVSSRMQYATLHNRWTHSQLHGWPGVFFKYSSGKYTDFLDPMRSSTCGDSRGVQLPSYLPAFRSFFRINCRVDLRCYVVTHGHASRTASLLFRDWLRPMLYALLLSRR